MGIREDLSERYGDALLFADGYDSAIIGVAIGFDSEIGRASCRERV